MLITKKIKFIIIISLIWFGDIFARYEVTQVHFDCEESLVCNRFKRSFSRLKGSFESKDHFQAVLKEYLVDVGYESLSFNLKGSNDSYQLFINVKPKKYIREVQVLLNGSKDQLSLSDSLLTKPESYFEQDVIQNDLVQLKNKLTQLGYNNVTSEYLMEDIRKDEVRVLFKANFLGTNSISQMAYNCKNSFITDVLKNNFNVYLNKTYVRDFIQQELSMLRKALMEQGYYQLDITLDTKVMEKGIALNFECKNEKLIVLEFKDPDGYMDWSKLYSETRALVSRVDSQFLIKELTQFFEKKYDKLGRKAHVKIEEETLIKNEDNKKVVYKILVQSEVRSRVKEILFRGNISFSHEQLIKLYYKHASDLAQSGYVDENYYKQFIEILKKEYYQQGLLTCNSLYLLRDETKQNNIVLSQPKESQRSSYPIKTLIFDVNEGVRSYVTEFKFSGLENHTNYEKIKDEIFALPAGTTFNPIKFEEDINRFLQRVKELGHFDAHYVESDVPLVSYERSAQQVFINLHIYLGPQYKVGNLYVVGLDRTKEHIVTRKVRLQSGELLTAQLLERIQSSIANLALFKSYDVKVLNYITEDNYRDIIIHVTEKDFGAVEIAPGYRTDLGLRLAGKIIYGNLFGLNHSASMEAELNNRLSHSNLDPSRSSNLGSMLEYEVKLNYNIPDIFKSYWDFNTSLSSARRRLYSFDAEIERFTNTFTHDFTSELNFSLRQQLEVISQFNAVQSINEGNFRIGSLTPSVTLDKRNNTAYATKGYLLNLSYELAKPEFLSSDSNGYDIDFYRLVNRNRFYIPFSYEFGLAFSVTFGIQENLERDPRVDGSGNQVFDANGVPLKKGFIPSIKVFRLSGIDTVRGFSEEEINRLPSGQDITTTLIQNSVYLTNVKIEPRYRWTDDMVFGVFWDAGKVQVEKFEATDIRSSVGVSFKYLTPVGTLDLDYGMKLLRKRYADGTIESPGRIHISIGFF
jgi:outer membrane protein insertion porin family